VERWLQETLWKYFGTFATKNSKKLSLVFTVIAFIVKSFWLTPNWEEVFFQNLMKVLW